MRANPVLAMGGELKNTFCLLRDGEAILSQHMGDLGDARVHADYLQALADYRHLFAFHPAAIAVDMHPEYLSRKRGMDLAGAEDLPLEEVQHHHAHVAACMAENGVARTAAPVLGIALDGLGYGADATLWGGEFLLTDYRDCIRLATMKPVAMPGGEQAIHEPWRNAYAHLVAALGWARFASTFGTLELHAFLARQPRTLLDAMITRGVNSPTASSCGRLFDAVAAAAGVCRERAIYEGQAAVELEARVDERTIREEGDERAYPLAIARPDSDGLPYLEPRPMWEALLDDLLRGVTVEVVAARFHKGLAIAVAGDGRKLAPARRGRGIGAKRRADRRGVPEPHPAGGDGVASRGARVRGPDPPEGPGERRRNRTRPGSGGRGASLEVRG